MTLLETPGKSADRRPIEHVLSRIGPMDARQLRIWRGMSRVRRLKLAFQAYQLALDAVRVTERRKHPDLSPEELNWRITRRMQGDPHLGRCSGGDRPGQ